MSELSDDKHDLTPEQEADYLLRLFGSPVQALQFLSNQFTVIQARSQFLLTLGTLTLTITGFSGPKIAQTNGFSRYSIALGIFLVLCSMLMMLLATNKIRWVTQQDRGDARTNIRTTIEYRNRKTRFYQYELYLLVTGLSCYVASVISFLIFFKG